MMKIFITLFLIKGEAFILITENAIVDIVYPYTKGKPNILVSIGIVTPSEVLKTCIGTDGKIQPVLNTTYEIGSITKSFVASLIVNLINQGIISLSDYVRKDITLEQLLTHSSGIKEYPLLQTGVNNPYSYITENDVISYVNNTEKGTGDWEYSNTGFSLIGIYLSEKLKTPFSKILEDFIKGPCNLKSTYIGYQGANLLGHNGEHAFRWQWDKNSAFLPAGCLSSSLDDMIKYLLLHMCSDMYQECHIKHLTTQMPFDMGLAFMRQKKTDIVFCMGLTEGFSSFIGFDSDKKYGVVVLSNYCGFGYEDECTPNGIGFSILNNFLY